MATKMPRVQVLQFMVPTKALKIAKMSRTGGCQSEKGQFNDQTEGKDTASPHYVAVVATTAPTQKEQPKKGRQVKTKETTEAQAQQPKQRMQTVWVVLKDTSYPYDKLLKT
ncbi:hypothetical protein NPIL_210501 [Nephila pilipes]|uniref:Uncharacterized protein n=1 Tax=Nephila pilipes TaxID=299642 RepID=A0A8X6PFV1_NEPPI|nr:hypothetical protein NPIL_210501 [Nephila pilipes]